MPKGNSGIKRASKSGGAKMTLEDQRYIADLKEKINRENQSIPSFVRDDMTREEIQRVLRKEIERTGEPAGGVYPLEINGRYPKPKDEHFVSLVRALNSTRVTGELMGRSREAEDFFIKRAEDITNHYPTKDLRRFITDELQGNIYQGGRKEYITTIGLRLMDRFHPRNTSGTLIRHSLYEPTYRLKQAAGEIKQAIGRRSVYQSRIAEIQAKYKGSKK